MMVPVRLEHCQPHVVSVSSVYYALTYSGPLFPFVKATSIHPRRPIFLIPLAMYIPNQALAAKTAPFNEPEPESQPQHKPPNTLIITSVPSRTDNNDCRTVPEGQCQRPDPVSYVAEVSEDLTPNGDINLGMRAMNQEDIIGIVVIVLLVITGIGIWISYGNTKGPRIKIRNWYRRVKTKIELWKNRNDDRTLAGSASPPDRRLVSPMSSAVTLTDKEVSDLGQALVGSMQVLDRDGGGQSRSGQGSAASSPRTPDTLPASPRPSDTLHPVIRREDSSLRSMPAVLAMRQQEG